MDKATKIFQEADCGPIEERIARHYANIPEGTKVVVIDSLSSFQKLFLELSQRKENIVMDRKTEQMLAFAASMGMPVTMLKPGMPRNRFHSRIQTDPHQSTREKTRRVEKMLKIGVNHTPECTCVNCKFLERYCQDANPEQPSLVFEDLYNKYYGK